MPAPRAIILATVLLAAGCGGAARGGSASGGGAGASGEGAGAPVAADAPQRAFAARFPQGRNEYWCQWVEDDGYTPEKQFTPIEITAASVKIHPTGETKYWNNFVEYPIDSGDAAYVRERDVSDEQRSVVLADGVLYMMVSAAGGAEPAIALACATKAEQRRIAGVEPRVHRDRVRAYAEARRQAFLASAGDLDLGDLDLGDVDLGDADGDGDSDADAPASRWTPAQAAQIARARTMTSFTFEASARDEGSETAVVVTATLADGATMRIGRGNPIFAALFDVSTLHGETGAQVEVIPLDEAGEQIRSRLQYQEIAYTFEGGSYSLHCEGAPGKTGVDQNWNDSGAMYRHGQRGEDGPDVTVEIAAASSGGALRYRLRCGDQQKVFNASASTEVIVSTTGGKGGHAIPKADGSGANGGNGGDGGDITVIVDPAVQRYNLTYGSNGGAGGRGSQSRGGTYGNGSDGRAGVSGRYVERRQPVTIP